MGGLSLSITLIIIIITSIVSIIAMQSRTLLELLLNKPYRVQHNKEIWRLLTSGFIHGGWMHLIFNMFVLYFFGRNTEYGFVELFGSQSSVIFVLFYLVAIVVSDFPTFLKHRNNPRYGSLGASGATSAVLYSSILMFPSETIYLYGIPIAAPIFAILYIAYTIYMGRRGGDNINHSAHLWGALFGLAFPLIFKPSLGPQFFESIKNLIGF